MFYAIFQYQMDTEQLSETLTKLNNSLDPKSISKKSNSEALLQLEVHWNFYSLCRTEIPAGRLSLKIKPREGARGEEGMRRKSWTYEEEKQGKIGEQRRRRIGERGTRQVEGGDRRMEMSKFKKKNYTIMTLHTGGKISWFLGLIWSRKSTQEKLNVNFFKNYFVISFIFSLLLFCLFT